MTYNRYTCWLVALGVAICGLVKFYCAKTSLTHEEQFEHWSGVQAGASMQDVIAHLGPANHISKSHEQTTFSKVTYFYDSKVKKSLPDSGQTVVCFIVCMTNGVVEYTTTAYSRTSGL